MKYQQLENLEAGWQWAYLVKKHKEGIKITRHIVNSENDEAIKSLYEIEHKPTQVLAWIENHMALELEIKLKQAIRAKRKRYYNAEQKYTKKKSIDLDFLVWEKLSLQAKKLDSTLSDTIEYLISHADSQEGEPIQSREKIDNDRAIEPIALASLTKKAIEMKLTLSQTIEYLLLEEKRGKVSLKQMHALKQDLFDLLCSS